LGLGCDGLAAAADWALLDIAIDLGGDFLALRLGEGPEGGLAGTFEGLHFRVVFEVEKHLAVRPFDLVREIAGVQHTVGLQSLFDALAEIGAFLVADAGLATRLAVFGFCLHGFWF